MKYRQKYILSFLLTLLLASACQFQANDGKDGPDPSIVTAEDVTGLMLTWQKDPATTVTIDWHTLGGSVDAGVQYRRLGNRPWKSMQASTTPFPYSERFINRAELTDLQPETVYEFRFEGSGVDFRFRTMPSVMTRDVVFAAGGDAMRNAEMFAEMNRQVARHDVDFVVLAGDLAYADGRSELVGRWYDWMNTKMETLVRPDRRVIPILVTLGNHEAYHGFVDLVPPMPESQEDRRAAAPYFFELFAMPGPPGYNVLDFGDYLSLFLLDSHHVNRIDGAQREWLRSGLSQRQHVTHLIPAYHVPAYPSVRSMQDHYVSLVRRTWVPLFEQYGVRLSIEAHDHAYKRTKPIRDGREESGGIVYIGDGAWGVNTRELGSFRATKEDPWYIAYAEPVRHFILVTLRPDGISTEAIDSEGNVFDKSEIALR